jgi:uncharacterized protein (UPF0261 family)
VSDGNGRTDIVRQGRLPKVALVGAFDTKGDEYGFVRDRLSASGVGAVLIDSGVLGHASIPVDIDRATVAHEGGGSLEVLAAGGDRSSAISVMANGAASIVRRLYEQGEIDAVMVLGGSNAGFVMSRVAQSLPIGPPKFLVSTIVAGDTRPYLGTSDLTMMYPVVDIAGLNSISIPVLARAADACAGMLNAPAVVVAKSPGPTIACTMFGVTTACVTAVHDELVAEGDEVHVFHANGVGGSTLEAMIASGFFAGVADITTTELADELLGGVCSAGPSRLTSAGAVGMPQVVSVGAMDMVNFGPRDSVPARFEGRLFHAHNPVITLMRTNAEENEQLGAILADKLNLAQGPVEVVIPIRGFSQVSVEGAPFYDPDADAALIRSLQAHLDPMIPLHLIDAAINDPSFALEITTALGRALTVTEGITQ